MAGVKAMSVVLTAHKVPLNKLPLQRLSQIKGNFLSELERISPNVTELLPQMQSNL